jgi:aminomethyltransferase
MEALKAEPARVRVGLKLIDRGIAREHMDVALDGKIVGHTTSGSPAPTLGGNYAMAIVEKDAAQAGTAGYHVRGRALKAEIVPLPFYKRGK